MPFIWRNNSKWCYKCIDLMHMWITWFKLSGDALPAISLVRISWDTLIEYIYTLYVCQYPNCLGVWNMHAIICLFQMFPLQNQRDLLKKSWINWHFESGNAIFCVKSSNCHVWFLNTLYIYNNMYDQFNF